MADTSAMRWNHAQVSSRPIPGELIAPQTTILFFDWPKPPRPVSRSSAQPRPFVRRLHSPESGRALEILGHAIEYLADEYANDQTRQGTFRKRRPARGSYPNSEGTQPRYLLFRHRGATGLQPHEAVAAGFAHYGPVILSLYAFCSKRSIAGISAIGGTRPISWTWSLTWDSKATGWRSSTTATSFPARSGPTPACRMGTAWRLCTLLAAAAPDDPLAQSSKPSARHCLHGQYGVLPANLAASPRRQRPDLYRL